ncbi:MAG: glycosyltransferase [Opitutae bacterium]|nr:glycosyltransferase [Opitutae bacterium]MBT5910212.1 glycosyltransferase [Opitutae bacterium]MBT6851540.1 glycosyltransferase [Opitutae bacterium]MBT7741097.1 glycosyltransferase [Opitutae bacterium]MBT7923060.1 glycosyltransferase [Opitutae bacterium]
MPKVSVIIPTYDRIETLPRSLNSVFKQTFSDWELIVVDDGSTDGTDEMVLRDYSSVRLHRQENKGVSSARNAGVALASGEWIAFLDSDDAWFPEKLERQLSSLATEHELRLSHTDEIWIRNGRRVNQPKEYAKSGGHLYRRCLRLCCICPSSVLIRKDFFEELGGFDEAFPACEDYDLWLRITAREPVHYLDQALVRKYGGHEDQLSTTVWGLDRYRIRALEKILSEEILSIKDQILTKEILIKKLRILIVGARKRGNQEVVAEYEPRLSVWEPVEVKTF